MLTHNRSALFTRAINSVLDNLPDFDLEIIVNNDTNDIDEIYNKHVSIQYHYYQNEEDLSRVYKYLFDISTGEYVYYLEDDDYIKPNFFHNIDLKYDINYMEYISEPLIREIGPYLAMKKISKNRSIEHKNQARGFLEQFDDEEFQLGQILFRRTLIDKFPRGNLLNNDYNLFHEIAKPGVTFKYIDIQTWTQTTDGNDNISFPNLNTDNRFDQYL
jgi:glycosyltransferase involved in cell wall biosynthesis